MPQLRIVRNEGKLNFISFTDVIAGHTFLYNDNIYMKANDRNAFNLSNNQLESRWSDETPVQVVIATLTWELL